MWVYGCPSLSRLSLQAMNRAMEGFGLKGLVCGVVDLHQALKREG